MTMLADRTLTMRALDEVNAERVHDIDLRMPCEWEIKTDITRRGIRDGIGVGNDYCDILCNEAIMIGF
jgi:hypothetical protein